MYSPLPKLAKGTQVINVTEATQEDLCDQNTKSNMSKKEKPG